MLNQELSQKNVLYVEELVKYDKYKQQYLDRCKQLDHVVIVMEQVK